MTEDLSCQFGSSLRVPEVRVHDIDAYPSGRNTSAPTGGGFADRLWLKNVDTHPLSRGPRIQRDAAALLLL
jgi:hypothetical protein